MSTRRLASLSLIAATLVLAPSAHAQNAWNSVTLTWTTPGDDGTAGTAAQFDLRYSTSPITASNFASATRWLGTPTPGTSGSSQSTTVTGPANDTRSTPIPHRTHS